VSEVAESSAWGAASAGLVGLGVYNSLEELAALSRAASSFKPQMADDAAELLLAGWKTAVNRVL
jgi:glycerol kinase